MSHENLNNSIPFYRRAYANRRNKYCPDHISSANHPYCDKCKEIQKGKVKLSVYAIGDGTPKGEMLDLAALLEYQVYALRLSVPDARYQFIEQYPECNIIHSQGKFVSVNDLIIPYHNSIQCIPISPIRRQQYS
jgi:hypothetical protein